jgi:undecaprenyl-diphosphatase
LRALTRGIDRVARRTGLSEAVVVFIGLAAVVVLAAGCGFTLLAEDALEAGRVGGVDPTIERFVLEHRTSAWTTAFRVVTRLGSGAVVIPVAAGVALWLLHDRLVALAIGLVTSVAGAFVLVAVMKPIVDRGRPPVVDRLTGASGDAFPSGHSATAIACYGAIAWVVLHLTPSRRVRLLAGLGAAVLALLIGVSRIYLGVHWTSDVLSGWFLGAAWLGTVVILTESAVPLARRGRARPGHSPPGVPLEE